MAKFEDLTGQRFGRLTVIRRDLNTKYKGVYWLCQCECGNFISTKTAALHNGQSKQCKKCADKEGGSKRIVDLTGKRIGEWTVLYKSDDYISPTGAHNSMWYCRCSCGLEKDVAQSSLRNGDSKSCGCKSSRGYDKFINLTGKRIGKLTVLYRTKNQGKKTMWCCKCDCGVIKNIWARSLIKENPTSSCGCLNSLLELYVGKYLQTHLYKYKVQYKFDDLRGIGGRRLPYDIAVFNDNNQLIYLIECQGKQHYISVEHFGGEEEFKKRQIHDEMKREYANKIGIPLIEIPYTVNSYEDIEGFLDERIKMI